MKSRATKRLMAIALICTWLPSVAAWGAQIVPPPTFLPLNQIPVPEPPNLFQFVKNKPVAIRLGKAFFWDMQVGSNGFQACGSCHFAPGGADNRLKNTVNPGTMGGDTTFQVRGPNEILDPVNDFPFFKLLSPDFPGIPLRQINDVVGSQGVHLTQFNAIVPGSAVDDGTPIPDPVFYIGNSPNTTNAPNTDPKNNTRRVTARNTPTNINAVFNFSNFRDGRAHFAFNGVNPFGPLDPSAGVWFNTGTAQSPVLQKQPVVIEFASLASQATGPPLDDTEMSYRGRTFPQLGRKMLSLTPLGKQLVHPNDSVLGSLSKAVLSNGKYSGNGLNSTYSQMIQDAFQDNLWNSTVPTPDGFSQMEANFSLFWGLAIQLYEATLISDDTPFDRFLGGDRTALTSQQQDGFNLFFNVVGCGACHLGSELTAASHTNAAFITNAANALIEPMTVASGQQIIYDTGFNNTAVRPTTEDIGRGGNSPFTNSLTGLFFPLSFSMLAELQVTFSLGFNPNLFPPGAPVTPILPAQLASNFPVANGGSFKVPGLRNVELTAPYFHNGGDMTLADVVEFYTRGGNFPVANRDSLDPAIIQINTLQNNPTNQAALVSFLMSLTDERVRNKSAPFDHPELFIPNGDPDIIHIPARDALGNAAPTIALTIDPVTTPTNRTSQVISGTNEPGATVTVSINGAAFPAVLNVGSTWNAALNGLVTGNNSIAVTATIANVTTTLTANIAVDTTAPLLTLAPVTTPTGTASQTISGTVDAGITPLVSVNTSATVGPVTVSAGTWSTQVSNLASGANLIVVAAVDSAGNFIARTATIDFSTAMTIADALRALNITVGLVPPTPADLALLDVAPLVNGVPTKSGTIDLNDALLILRKVVGLVTF